MTKKKTNPDSEDSIPTFSEESGSLGTIRINHSVVAGIVRLATQSVKGVINVGGAGVVEGLTDFFAKKESERGVSVSEQEDGTYKIEVRVVLRFGVDLAKTGAIIQEAIRDQILSMTGNHASVIDVVIDDIKQESLDRDEDEDTWSGPDSN
ncbi:MAG: Asp23/Gls24 family envelope stress response protein [Verrucomicrobia bacterium]|nr:Asp23/Gls24 family envelope stress response protein [Verrucomicrobiota bacterium]